MNAVKKLAINRLLLIAAYSLISSSTISAQSVNYKDYTGANNITYRYSKPKHFEFITNVPGGLLNAVKAPFRKGNLFRSGLLIGGTALIVTADQPIYEGTQKFGRFINLSTDRSIKTIWEPVILGQPAPIEVPTTFSSGLYYIGEGWPSIMTVASFYAIGKIKNDYRALQTASQITQTMISVGIVCQVIKHISGRESPFVASKPGGEWRPFTNPSEYAETVPKYDAFPSGHLATMVGTFTVLLSNYPDVKILKPIAFTLTTVVAFQMINNGVHWFSDYPLAFLIGYGLGKYAVNRGRVILSDKAGATNRNKFKVSPIFGFNGITAVSLSYNL